MYRVTKNLLRYLNSCRAINQKTTLISLYIPHNSSDSKTERFLKQELKTTQRIRDKNTQKMVQRNLKSLIHWVSQNKIHTNGLALFAGLNEVVAVIPL